MRIVHFTIEATDSGVTDQLTQFNAFYKLGMHLGFQYIHTPFISGRSNAREFLPVVPTGADSWRSRVSAWTKRALPWRENSFVTDIHGFIGLNRYFERECKLTLFDFRDAQRKTISLSDEHLLERDITSFDSLLEYVSDTARSFENSSEADPSGTTLIKFRLDGERKKVFSMIQKNIIEFPGRLNLPEIYLAERRRAPIRSLYHRQNGTLKLLLHIRQGDTGVIETPWKTYLPVWSTMKDCLKESDRFDQIACTEKLFEISEYKSFLDEFVSRLDDSRKSILIFSDGANRGFEHIEQNLSKMDWPPEKVRRFIESKSDYDKRQFACFASSTDVELHIGEEPLKLCQLINSVLEADIVIVSNQQRMIPKLVANLSNANSPRVIVLYKRNMPINTDLVHNHQERFIYVDINNPDYDSLIRRLRA